LQELLDEVQKRVAQAWADIELVDRTLGSTVAATGRSRNRSAGQPVADQKRSAAANKRWTVIRKAFSESSIPTPPLTTTGNEEGRQD